MSMSTQISSIQSRQRFHLVRSSSARRQRLGLAAAACALAIAVVAAPAHAAPRARIALGTVAGPGGEHMRRMIAERLSASYDVVPLGAVDRALARAGAPASWTAAEHAAFAQGLRASAFVDGQLTITPSWRIRLYVRPARARTTSTIEWGGDRPRDVVSDVLAETPGKLLALLARAERVAPPRPRSTPAPFRRHARILGSGPFVGEPMVVTADLRPDGAAADDNAGELTDTAEIADDDDWRSPPPAAALPVVEAAFGARAVSRTLAFTDNLAGVPGYRLALAPALGGHVVVLPAARTGSPLRGLGLAAAWESTFGARTAGRAPGASHETQHTSHRLGARWVAPVGPTTITSGLDWGQQRFALALEGARFSPAVRYRFVRPAVELGVGAGDFQLAASAAYLHVTDHQGGLGAAAFPRASVVGAEAGLRLAYALDGELTLAASVDFRRFAFAMNAAPGDALAVGGAIDDYLALGFAFNYRLP